MITLRDICYRDTAIGAITMDECRFMSKMLLKIGESWFLRWLLGVPKDSLRISMLGATLGRTPKEMVPIETDIRIAMVKEMGSNGL